MAGGFIMSKHIFKSVHANTFNIFIGWKHAQGYDYSYQEVLLYRFDSFLCEHSYSCTDLTREIIDKYTKTFSNCKAFTLLQMLSVIRVYSQFLNLRYPQSYVLKMPPSKPKRPSRFYIYTTDEIMALLHAAEKLGPAGSVRPYTVKTLIALLYVCGLRISEALALNTDDLDAKQQTLFVRKGKFGKDRYVPLATSSVEALLRYREKGRSSFARRAIAVIRPTTIREQSVSWGRILFARITVSCPFDGPFRCLSAYWFVQRIT
jgi:integrase